MAKREVNIGRIVGQSAYELWKSQPGNESKSEQDFLTSLKGEKGDKGDTGATGPTGATGAKGDKGDTGEVGPTGPAGAKGDKGDKGDTGEVGPTGPAGAAGKSTYEIWKAQPGNESKSEQDFLTSLKGDKGDKGDTGATGPKGDKGDPATDAETAKKLASTFGISIAGVKKTTDGSEDVTFTKTELGIPNMITDEFTFKQVFDGYSSSALITIENGESVKNGMVFLVQFVPRVRAGQGMRGKWAYGFGDMYPWNQTSRRYHQPSMNFDIDFGMDHKTDNIIDYSLCTLITTIPLMNEDNSMSTYLSASYYNFKFGSDYHAVERIEFMPLKSNVENMLNSLDSFESNLNHGNTFGIGLLAWTNGIIIKAVSNFGYPGTEPYITKVWKLVKR